MDFSNLKLPKSEWFTLTKRSKRKERTTKILAKGVSPPAKGAKESGKAMVGFPLHHMNSKQTIKEKQLKNPRISNNIKKLRLRGYGC